MPEHRQPHRPPPRTLPQALRAFLDTEAAGGVVLLAAAVAAMAWVNSPFGDSYERVWRTVDLRHWINEGLMAVFFFVVGLEIKHEVVAGQLREWRRAALPAAAAVGGMVVPALVFVACNAGHPGVRGWAIPIATDIAFALGVLRLLGPRVPDGLRVFVVTLAIVDDIGAIVVIAIVYSVDVEPTPLLAAFGLLAVIGALRRFRVGWPILHVLLGIGVWIAVLQSGVHATIAGVAMALLTPARSAGPSGSETERLEAYLHPVTSFVVVPVFALANAGVVLDGAALAAPGASRVAIGVAAGLVVGKLVGVTAGAAVAHRFGLGVLMDGVGWGEIVGAAALAGIGFTVSLFVTDLAFHDADLQAASKVGIVAASLVAAAVGAMLVRFSLARRMGSRS